MLDQVDKLKIAFVTDIHLNQSGMEKLKQWMIEYSNTEPQFDYCLIGGDTANCHYDLMSHNEQQMMDQTIETHKELKKIFACPLFFVPGNHDCKVFYETQSQVGKFPFTNIHNRIVELSEGLDLMGLGGSTPGLVEGDPIWSGFPYNNHEQLEAEAQKGQFFKPNTPDRKNYCLVLTHEGPSYSETTLDRRNFNQRTVQTGSTYLNTFLNRKDICLWLHGHTHEGGKYSMINGIPVLNPGALKNNEFMHFQLSKEKGKWSLSKTSFIKL